MFDSTATAKVANAVGITNPHPGELARVAVVAADGRGAVLAHESAEAGIHPLAGCPEFDGVRHRSKDTLQPSRDTLAAAKRNPCR
jgi:hypothetical protein